MHTTYLVSTKKQFEYYKMLGEKTIAQLPDDKIFWQYNNASNSIAVIVKHLSGNMLSRWTDFLNADGEKEWRNRDKEFENDFKTKDEIILMWDDGWNCLFNAFNALKDEDFSKIIYIRNQAHSITDAINRQLAHYSYHIGQIVFIGKMICNGEWMSLSIPKGNSKTFNEEKFSSEKNNGHYTDEEIRKHNNMKKSEIISRLKTAHSTFCESAFQLPNPTFAIGEKWSVSQNVDHINISLKRLGAFLGLPKSDIRKLYGTPESASMTYNELTNIYLQAISNGTKATAPFIPELNPDGNIESLISQGKNWLEVLTSTLQNWSEEELDLYNCPHPALGLITIREILYFTIYHVQHHDKIIKKNAGK